MPKPTIDLTGQRFGRLTVLRRGENALRKDGRHNATFVCQCDCGNVVTVLAIHLKTGNTQSCGCIHKESIGNLNKTHGQTKTRLYRIYLRMKQRCTNESLSDYQHYGGRGISVCDEWSTFEPFLEWAMQTGYNNTLTIDRIDNSQGYSPDNCRWVTMAVQANNKRNNRLLTHDGKTQTLSQWATEIGIGRSTIEARLSRGWSISDALTKPLRTRRKNES